MNKEELQSFKNELEKTADYSIRKEMAMAGTAGGSISLAKDLYSKAFKKIPMSGYKARMIENAAATAATIGLLGLLRKKFNKPTENDPFDKRGRTF